MLRKCTLNRTTIAAGGLLVAYRRFRIAKYPIKCIKLNHLKTNNCSTVLLKKTFVSCAARTAESNKSCQILSRETNQAVVKLFQPAAADSKSTAAQALLQHVDRTMDPRMELVV